VEIATIKTHMGWLTKGVGALAFACLLGAGWLFYNVYQPIQTLSKDSAVQTSILGDIKDDIKEIKDRLDLRHDYPQAGNPAEQAPAVHPRTP
jgi:hypothetical protein